MGYIMRLDADSSRDPDILPSRQEPPGEPQRSAEREGPVHQPEVEVKAQGGAFERREGVHVERNRMVDDLVEELLAQLDLAIPQRGLIGLALALPKNGAVGH